MIGKTWITAAFGSKGEPNPRVGREKGGGVTLAQSPALAFITVFTNDMCVCAPKPFSDVAERALERMQQGYAGR